MRDKSKSVYRRLAAQDPGGVAEEAYRYHAALIEIEKVEYNWLFPWRYFWTVSKIVREVLGGCGTCGCVFTEINPGEPFEFGKEDFSMLFSHGKKTEREDE